MYSSRKMKDESDSSDCEGGMFKPFRRSYRTRRLSSNLPRSERRTALSLRPINRKCYADDQHSPLFNSDEGRKILPARKRSVRFQNTSWLADEQIHKVGYPCLNNIPYSEEDSRDVADTNGPEEMRRSTRQNKLDNSNVTGKTPNNSKYSYNTYEGKRTSNTRNDKEKDENSSIRRLRSQREIKQEIVDEEEAKLNDETTKDTINSDENKEENSGEKKISTDSDAPLKLPKRGRRAVENDKQYRLPPHRRSRKDSSTSDLTDEDEQQQRRRRNKPSENNIRPYSFRQRPPKPPPEQRVDFPRSETPRNYSSRRRYFRRHRRSSSSSSSNSDSAESMRTYNKTPKGQHSKNEQRMKVKQGGSNIIPIGPEKLDGSVRFNSIGGLDNHVQCLKEMVILPMMYPEVFKQFHITPPRGVLFYGPPGTGKTLLARALANECSFGKRKISFFMRKGADLLSKWIGESEKQLRLLFQQASEMKPSIIFFDELDGLVPVRTSRNDQIHASIVSTLLALMDGLDDRGEIIVIGATNRVDAIDPAFRRPGRFDRELHFPLPARKEREEILDVHVSEWINKPNPQLMSYLAEHAVGYCGSDLRALCTEAVIQSFRRTYPQVYNSEHKLLLNPEEVNVKKLDFMRAKSVLIPASHRTNQCVSRKLMPILEPLLGKNLKSVFSILETTFPHGVHEKLARVKLSANIKPAQMLLEGDGSEHGQTTHLGPAVVFQMEHIQCYTLDLIALHKETHISPEEATIQIFTESKRNIPSVIYMPCIDKFWTLVSDTTKVIFSEQLSRIEPNVPILLLATSDTKYEELPEEIKELFSPYRKEVVHISEPTSEQRKAFFKPLILDRSMQPLKSPRQRPRTPPSLPKAPTPPPPQPSEEEMKKMYEQEEHTLRELRIFLRDMCRKLAHNKMFYMFTKPVDLEEVPDYPTIIKQPMDLETMMMKVDFHRYECAKDFLQDIELIVQNALEYNPSKTSADKLIRHRACSLRDYAYTLIKTEMDSDFEDKCQDISRSRKKRLTKVNKVKFLPEYLVTPEILARLDAITEKETEEPKIDKLNVKPEEFTNNKVEKVTPLRKKRSGAWQKGFLKPNKRKKKEKSSPEPQETESNNKVSCEKSSEDEDDETKEIKPEPESAQEEMELVNGTSSTGDIPMTPTKCGTDSLLSPSRRKISDIMSPSELLEDSLCFDDVDKALNEDEETIISNFPIECPLDKLEEVLDEIVKSTEKCNLQSLLDLHNEFSIIIRKYSRSNIRKNLPEDLRKELNRFNERKFEKISSPLSIR